MYYEVENICSNFSNVFDFCSVVFVFFVRSPSFFKVCRSYYYYNNNSNFIVMAQSHFSFMKEDATVLSSLAFFPKVIHHISMKSVLTDLSASKNWVLKGPNSSILLATCCSEKYVPVIDT